MRLLKFNEGQFYTIENTLYNFAVENLIYLLDDGLKVDVKINKRLSDSGSNNYYSLLLYSNNRFEWEDIKDYFISFLIRLENLDYVYITHNLIFNCYESTDRIIYFSLNEVINDSKKLEKLEIYKIELYIKQIN